MTAPSPAVRILALGTVAALVLAAAPAPAHATDAPAPILPPSEALLLARAGDAAGLLARYAPRADLDAAGALAYALALGRADPRGATLLDPTALPPLAPADVDPLTAAVGVAYEALGLAAPSAEASAAMRAQEARLDPAVARGAAALVLDLAAHHILQRAAMARVGDAGVARLLAIGFAEPAERSGADRGEAAALLTKLGQPMLLGSAARVARAADELALALRAAPAAEAAGGFVFRDPFDLVLVGDAGPNVYAGNTANVPTIAAFANLLTLDLGGDDLYTNNAGGAGVGSPSCVATAGNTPVGCGNGVAAAAAIDLAGDDTYATEQRAQGATTSMQAMQGAGFAGVGLLRDLAGDDTYLASLPATTESNQLVQGSGLLGVGILVDDAGDDAYVETMQGVTFSRQWAQGAGPIGGVGVLLDRAGNDTYLERLDGALTINQYGQGLGDLLGAGALLELGGDDRYEIVQVVRHAADEADLVSGGAPEAEDGDQWAQGMALDGPAAFVDLAGDDTYVAIEDTDIATDIEVQGVSDTSYVVMLEGAGNDSYLVEVVIQGTSAVYAQGTAGRVVAGTMGAVLAELGGNDRYEVRQAGRGVVRMGAQGMGDLAGHGLLWDHAGDDAYAAFQVSTGDASQWVQGAATHGLGALVEDAGADTYLADQRAPGTARQFAQGAAEGGLAVLLDEAGDDRYLAVQPSGARAAQRAQGAADNLGGGFLVDLAGDDAYAATGPAGGDARAQGAARCATGVLVDADGTDGYVGSAGRDDAVWGPEAGGLGADVHGLPPAMPALPGPPALPTPAAGPACSGGVPCLPVALPLDPGALPRPLVLPPCSTQVCLPMLIFVVVCLPPLPPLPQP
ncbi:MAG TPA: hypothetical protein VGR28_14275 [Candidatus Thermoplasmatota archaeon]|jgi:hypothetical protein|nr:hypothetical protein [Candidatus Thermoplasmatota archaeon]